MIRQKHLRNIIATIGIGYAVALLFVAFGQMLTAAFVLTLFLLAGTVSWFVYLGRYVAPSSTWKHRMVSAGLGAAFGGHAYQIIDVAITDYLYSPIVIFGPEMTAIVIMTIYGLVARFLSRRKAALLHRS